MSKLKKTILIVGFPNSIHVENWIKKIDQNKFNLILFPSNFFNPTKFLSKYCISYNKFSLFLRAYSLIFAIFNFNFLSIKTSIKQIKFNHILLKFVIEKYNPDIIHCMELQHAGYLFLKIFRNFKNKKFKFFISNYGSDIFYFEKYQHHLKKIKLLLNLSDLYICESDRDIKLAKKYKKNINYLLIPNSCPTSLIKNFNEIQFKKKRRYYN